MAQNEWTSGYKPKIMDGVPEYSMLPDFRGKRRGALVVIGYGVHRNRWVVQCDCGLYAYRSTRSLRRQNMDDYCGECASEASEFKKEFFQKHGRYPEYFELPA